MKLIRLYKSIKKHINIIKNSKKFSNDKIAKNKVIFWSYRGRSYSCNPKYITEYIVENSKKSDFQLVWAFKNIEEYRWLENKGIKLVKYYSIEFFKELMTAHFIITNARFGIDFHKRNGQIYIQTWHGTLPLKTIEKDAKKNLSKDYLLNAIYDSKKTDYILSGCKFNSEIIEKSFWYKGKILNIGNPRNDIFFKTEKSKNKVLKKYNIINKSIILYAPTFRNNGDITNYDIDYKMILEIANKKFNKEFVIFTRLHPNLKDKCFSSQITEEIIDVTNYDDMQELLCASDILITDFSSSMFDFCIMKKPCILYASDFDKYSKNERKLYFNVENELPFSVAKNNMQLKELIENFDYNEYYKKINKFNEKIGLFEDGNASKRIVDLIIKLCEK